MLDLSKTLRNIAYVAVASGSLVMAGCGGGSSSSSSDEQDPVVTPEPTPEPTPVEDPQPETLVYTGSEEPADFSDLDAIAAEVAKAAFVGGLLNLADAYTYRIPDVMWGLAGGDSLSNITNVVPYYGYSADSELDLDLETVYQTSETETFQVAGSCGGVVDLSRTYGEELAAGEDEVGYGQEITTESSLDVEFSDDYCQSAMSPYGGPLSDTQVQLTGVIEADYSYSIYEDYDGEDDFERYEESMVMSGDLDIVAEGMDMRYQFDHEYSYDYFEDDRTEPYPEGEEYSETVNTILTMNGLILEHTYTYLEEYTYDSESGSEYSYDSREIVVFEESVFLIDDIDVDLSGEDQYEIDEADVALGEFGMVYFEAYNLTFCADGSGYATGTIEFGADYDELVGQIVLSGCGDNATLTVTDISVPPVAASE